MCCLAETEPQLLGAFNKVAATNFRDDVDDGIALHVVPTSKLEKSQRKAKQTGAGEAGEKGVVGERREAEGTPTAPEIKCHVIHATTTCGYKLHVPRLQRKWVQEEQERRQDCQDQEEGSSSRTLCMFARVCVCVMLLIIWRISLIGNKCTCSQHTSQARLCGRTTRKWH